MRNGLSIPDPARTVHLGHFGVDAYGQALYVALAEGCWLHLDTYQVQALAEAIGVPIRRIGGSSWQHESWNTGLLAKITGSVPKNLVGGYVGDVIFNEESCTWCHHEIKIPVGLVQQAIVQLACPYFSSKMDDLVLKRCEYCCYFIENGCRYRSPMLKPLRSIFNNYPDYVSVFYRKEHRYVEWGAELSFTIEGSGFKDIVEALPEDHQAEQIDDQTQDVWTFIKQYSFKNNMTDQQASKYWITVKGTEGIGRIVARECFNDCSREDFDTAQSDLHSGKVWTVIDAFGKVCQASRGQVQPVFHGKFSGSRFRSFMNLVEQQPPRPIVVRASHGVVR